MSSKLPIFITGNPDKAAHFSELIGFEIDHQKLDLVEMQSTDPEEIIEHKVRQAYEILKRPVLVDDFSAGFDDWGGLPGPFIKYFIDATDDGLERLCRMADSLPTRRMTQRAYIGYYDGTIMRIFHGELRGEVVDYPRVAHPETRAYGSDPIFAPDGYGGLTRAELTPTEYADMYSIIRPIAQVRQFLAAKPSLS